MGARGLCRRARRERRVGVAKRALDARRVHEPRRATEKDHWARADFAAARKGRHVRVLTRPLRGPPRSLWFNFLSRRSKRALDARRIEKPRRAAKDRGEEIIGRAQTLPTRAPGAGSALLSAHWMLDEFMNHRGPRRATEKDHWARADFAAARKGRHVRVLTRPLRGPPRSLWFNFLSRRSKRALDARRIEKPRRAAKDRGEEIIGRARTLPTRAPGAGSALLSAHWMLDEFMNHRGPRRATEKDHWARADFAAARAGSAGSALLSAHWMLDEFMNHGGPRRRIIGCARTLPPRARGAMSAS